MTTDARLIQDLEEKIASIETDLEAIDQDAAEAQRHVNRLENNRAALWRLKDTLAETLRTLKGPEPAPVEE